jgi:hypothetical protein
MNNLDHISEDIKPDLVKASDKYTEIEADILEFAQGPTGFQIEVFIANGEGPIDQFPVHSYRHLLAQVRPLLSELRRVLIEKERTSREIQNLKNKQSANWDLDVLELQYKLREMEVDLKGKWQTYRIYEKLLTYIKDKYGPFTNDDLQKGEAEYWRYRLSKQMLDSKQGAMTGYGSGNINSLRMAFQGSILPDSEHRLSPFDVLDDALLNNISKGQSSTKIGLNKTPDHARLK